MNAKEFLNKVFKMFPFPRSYAEAEKQEIFNEYYYKILKEGNFDFDSAYDYLLDNYKKQSYPTYAELKELLVRYRIVHNESGMTCPVQLINFKVTKNGVKKEGAFSTADCSYEELKRNWEQAGWKVLTDKYGEEKRFSLG